MNWSYWEKSTFTGNRHVVIIGAGITGLNAAISLKVSSPELSVLVIERGVLPSGASTKNAGFACFGSLSELMSDEERVGINDMVSLVEKRYRGLRLLRELYGDEAIDYKAYGGYEMFDKTDASSLMDCQNNIERYNELLHPIVGKQVYSMLAGDDSRFGLKNTAALIRNQYEGQIDTGKMMKAMMDRAYSLDVEFLFGTSVDRLEKNEVLCSNGLVFKARKIIVATNGFARELIDFEVLPARAQVLVTKPIKGLKLKGSFHFKEGYFYFRNINDRLLIGGGRQVNFKSEETTEMNVTDEIQQAIIQVINRHILHEGSYEIDYAWSGIMGIGKSSKSPIVEQVDSHVVVAVRLGGMGVAIGSVVGQEAAQLILESI